MTKEKGEESSVLQLGSVKPSTTEYLSEFQSLTLYMALHETPFTCNMVSWTKELCIAGYRIWISEYDAGIHTLYYALAVAVLLPELDVPSRYLLPVRLT
jgi:hypothetical protein